MSDKIKFLAVVFALAVVPWLLGYMAGKAMWEITTPNTARSVFMLRDDLKVVAADGGIITFPAGSDFLIPVNGEKDDEFKTVEEYAVVTPDGKEYFIPPETNLVLPKYAAQGGIATKEE